MPAQLPGSAAQPNGSHLGRECGRGGVSGRLQPRWTLPPARRRLQSRAIERTDPMSTSKRISGCTRPATRQNGASVGWRVVCRHPHHRYRRSGASPDVCSGLAFSTSAHRTCDRCFIRRAPSRGSRKGCCAAWRTSRTGPPGTASCRPLGSVTIWWSRTGIRLPACRMRCEVRYLIDTITNSMGLPLVFLDSWPTPRPMNSASPDFQSVLVLPSTLTDMPVVAPSGMTTWS